MTEVELTRDELDALIQQREAELVQLKRQYTEMMEAEKCDAWADVVRAIANYISCYGCITFTLRGSNNKVEHFAKSSIDRMFKNSPGIIEI